MPSLAQRRELAWLALEAQRRANLAQAKRDQDPTLWAQTIWTIRGDTDQPYRITNYPFITEVVRQRAREVTIMAGSGCSKTESFIPYALAKADWGGRILYFIENDMKTSLLVQERVNPNFKSSAYLRERNQGEVDNIHLKKIGSGFVYFLGMNSDSATRSYHGDEAIFDEYDAMAPGRIADMHKRLSTAQDPLFRNISNPSRPNVGIHKKYLEGDQRQWHVTCADCSAETLLDLTTHVDFKTATLICPACRAPLRTSRERWVPTNPKGNHPSYRMHRLMTRASLNLRQLIEDLNSEDSRKVSAATRMDLGLPFEDADAGLTETDLRQTDGGDVWTKHAPGGYLTCDPGGVFDVQIWERPQPGVKPRCVWAGTVSGWNELRSLVVESQVAGGVIDFGPENKAAKEFCDSQRASGRYFVRVSYSLGEGDDTPDYRWSDDDATLLLTKRTGVIDEMVSEVRRGAVQFSSRLVRESLGRWSQHMKSPKRVVEVMDSGKTRVRWDHEETRPDHQFHCSTYASIYRRAVLARVGGGKVKVLAKGTY